MKSSKAFIASELAKSFQFAEFHCALLMRDAGAGNFLIPDLPSLDDEAAQLQGFDIHIDDISILELKATLRSVALAFSRFEAGSISNRRDFYRRLCGIKRRLNKAASWLNQIAEGDSRVGPLSSHGQCDAEIGIVAPGLSLDVQQTLQ